MDRSFEGVACTALTDIKLDLLRDVQADMDILLSPSSLGDSLYRQCVQLWGSRRVLRQRLMDVDAGHPEADVKGGMRIACI